MTSGKKQEIFQMHTKFMGLLGLCAAGLTAMAAPAMAHHSFSSEFDANSPITLEGEVLKMEWVNPHSWLHIRVVNDQGVAEDWKVEGGAPSALLRRGWNRDSLPPGTSIVVQGYRAFDGSLRANARTIEFPDGKQLFIGSTGRGAPDGE
jgi:hypothetical protein